MKHFVKIVAIVVLSLFAIAAKAPEVAPESEVEWLTFEQAIAQHDKKPKKLLIDLYTDWCGWCKKMDQTTYSKSELAQYINTKYYPVKFNAEQAEAVIFKDHTFKFVPSGRKGYHELAAALTQNKLSYPTTVFMDEKLQIIQPIPGYMDAPTMDVIVRYIGEDHFKTTAWADFQKKYKSSL